ncbi:hypothetical protein [Streptomyces sp. NRRL S-118]|uniref:hypothetical protein n=1 Tax=Streptomyces sp. NRRL S-118 TaxID=1463881 RepID=UPI0007C7F219|nr:hypothetical protein [Streptomyces sp. NRRL S-118]
MVLSRRGSATTTVARAAVAAVALLLTAACDDAQEPPPRPTATGPSATPPSRSPSPGTSPSAPVSPSPAPTAATPEDPAAAQEEIRTSWARFFGPESSVQDRVDVAENGEQYRLMIEALTTDREARLLRVRVDSVTFGSDLRAAVRYKLFSDGRDTGHDAPGSAVYQDGTWKVSFGTVCSLTQYGEDVPQAATCPPPD